MVSIFTPTHDSSFLPQVYDSLKAQTDPDWEWVVLFNNGAEPIDFHDDRVKCHYVYKSQPWVGPLKAAACDLCTGDILLEMDHDDLLLPEAVAEVKQAFEDPEVGFVYSNTIHAHVQPDGTLIQTLRFSEIYGWKYREVEYAGVKLDEHVSFPPTPESVSRIWFAPNHLRAFRAATYQQVGGYNKEMRILDDLDLMCRLYGKCKFQHIDKGLYVYRVHGQNSWLRYNDEIQQNVYRIYDQFIESLTEQWACSNGLRKIELGGRMYAKKGYETVDLRGKPDIVANLDNKWPFKTSSVGIIRAMDTFEHLKDPLHTMRELSRVLAPGGWAFIQVPSTDGRGAFQDPTHVSFWNENSFYYYTRQHWAQYIDTPVRFQAPRLFTTEKNAEGVNWVIAHLINCKDGYRPCGALEI
jgi:glycosyltransferase involved in cell wall biosynthesis